MRYWVRPKRFDEEEGMQVFGVWDQTRAIWVTESYSQVRCERDADFLEDLSKPEHEKEYA